MPHVSYRVADDSDPEFEVVPLKDVRRGKPQIRRVDSFVSTTASVVEHDSQLSRLPRRPSSRPVLATKSQATVPSAETTQALKARSSRSSSNALDKAFVKKQASFRAPVSAGADPKVKARNYSIGKVGNMSQCRTFVNLPDVVNRAREEEQENLRPEIPDFDPRLKSVFSSDSESEEESRSMGEIVSRLFRSKSKTSLSNGAETSPVSPGISAFLHGFRKHHPAQTEPKPRKRASSRKLGITVRLDEGHRI
ncbi:hypothetical protein BT69DRAFT_1317829 [Atractiella rhizophila]|nr:hypothetical protein BT69DRAFT_1317829 [Atractiella rhizophila]